MAIGASNSKKSINKRLAGFAASQIDGATVNLLDLNDYEMPIYRASTAKRNPASRSRLTNSKHNWPTPMAIVISFAEHNGAYAAAFKNIFDWISRIDQDVWMNKPMLLMATSPGGRGGKTVLDIAVNKFVFMNSNTITSFSLPSFYNQLLR